MSFVEPLRCTTKAALQQEHIFHKLPFRYRTKHEAWWWIITKKMIRARMIRGHQTRTAVRSMGMEDNQCELRRCGCKLLQGSGIKLQLWQDTRIGVWINDEETRSGLLMAFMSLIQLRWMEVQRMAWSDPFYFERT
jgi:hypothetical protein